ncbi:MAG: serine/threonine-protein kinase [Thermoguttaceae bacterium]
MHEQVTTVKPNGNESLEFSAAELGEPGGPGESAPSKRPTAGFVHPGGSRPLDGYTIKRGVGHGGFGEIYYAISDAGKEVALKLIRRNLDIELRGIRHCLNLKHPNLLSLYDIRQDDQGDTWVVMEYVAGGCLADAMASHPDGMPIDETLRWFHGSAAGIACLHDRGIVHRDVKPGNLFCDEGVIKVGDYGLSKFVSCSHRSGQTESVGTVHYMAPEVANGRYGKEIDIYALGILLYEMLTGHVPFEGESVGEILMKHLTAKPDVSMLAQPYRNVVAKALEKDPAERFDSVAQMAAALPHPSPSDSGPGFVPGMGPLPGEPGGGQAGNPASEDFVDAETVEVHAVDEEPIEKAVRDGCRKLQAAWDDADLPTPVKVAILVVGSLIVLANTALVPLFVMLLILYGLYRIVRMLVLQNQPSSRPNMGTSGPAAATHRRRPVPHHLPGHRKTQPYVGRKKTPAPAEKAKVAMVVPSPRDRLTELIGSMLVGALVAVAMCVVMVMLCSVYRGVTPQPEQCAWLVLMSILGTWAVMVPSKFWEGTRGEPMLRRFIMMVMGLGLGAVACLTADVLMVDLPYVPLDLQIGPNYELPSSFYAAGRPLMMAYLACFGTLFLLLRWWRQANPMRRTRLSILWALPLTILAATAVATVWHFPQPWLPMVAGTIAVAVQLATPWVHPRNRPRA